MKNKKEKTNKKFTILGMSIWRVLAYFIIYSIFLKSVREYSIIFRFIIQLFLWIF